METKQQIDHLIELAIVQRAELKRLVEQLPALRSYLLEQINATIEDMEPQLRGDLIDFCDEKTSRKIEEIHAFFNGAKSEFKTKSDEFFVALEKGAQARFEELQREKQIALDFAEDARRNLAAAAEQEAAKIPAQVSQLVEKELARFPRAGEIDQLRKEFAEPRGLNPRGKWKSTETYQKLDLVAFNGDSYISNVNDNREKPSRTSVSWTLSAARGQGAGGGGISSLNDLVGPPTSDFDVVGAEGSNYVRKTLTAGTNITLTETPSSITIDAAGGNSAQILTATVTNAESVAITRGQVVYAYAATGNRVSVKLAYNTSDATSAKTFGVVSDDSIAAGDVGTVTCVGVVDRLNLGTYAEGDTVYLSATPGAFTSTKPYAPNHLVYVGIVERANNGNGELYVKIQNGYELDEIHDVQITAPVLSGSTLLYDATNSLWKNARLTGTANQVKITNADNSVTLGLESQIAISGQSLTGSSATSLLDLSTTWNTTGAPTAIKLNVTNAASASNSNLLDLQVGGVSKVLVRKDGYSFFNQPIIAQSDVQFTGGSVKGRNSNFAIYSTSGAQIGWGSSSNDNSGSNDTALARNAAGVVEINNGTAGQYRDLIARNISLTGTSASTSTSTGALVVSGGAGIAGAVYAGADSYFNGVRVGKGAGAIADNTVVGNGALSANTTGSLQAAFGFEALANNSSGAYNSAFGYRALRYVNTGNANLGVGYLAGQALTSGNYNTAVGAVSLNSITTGTNNVALGCFAGRYETGSNAFYVDAYDRTNTAGDKAGALLYGTFNATPSSQTLTINAATTVSNTTDSTSTSTGSLVVSGGLGVAKKTYFGDSIRLNRTGSSIYQYFATSSSDNWAFGIGLNNPSDTDLGFYSYSTASVVLRLNYTTGAGTLAGALTVSSGTQSTSTTTGSIVTAGGIGVAGRGWFGNEIISSGGNAAVWFYSRGGSNSNFAWYSNDGTKASLYESGGNNIFEITNGGNASVKGSIKSTSATGGIGYATGAGGAVTQATSRTTGVTLDKVTGAITLVSAAGTTTWQSFTVTNSAVAATDVIKVVQKSGTDKYQIFVTAVAAGSFQITYATTGGTTTEQPVFNFAVIKGVAA